MSPGKDGPFFCQKRLSRNPFPLKAGEKVSYTPYIMSKSVLYTLYYTIWKNKYSPAPRILSPFRTPPNASTLGEASLFDHFWVDPKCLNYMNANHKSSWVSRFFRGRVKKSKKHDTQVQMTRKCITFLRLNFTFIFQEIHQTLA